RPQSIQGSTMDFSSSPAASADSVPHSALFTVIDFKFRTHRCGFLSSLSISLNWPSSPSGFPFTLNRDNHLTVMLRAFNLRHRVQHPVLVRSLRDKITPQHLPVSRLIDRQSTLRQQVAQQHARVTLFSFRMFVVDRHHLLRHPFNSANDSAVALPCTVSVRFIEAAAGAWSCPAIRPISAFGAVCARAPTELIIAKTQPSSTRGKRRSSWL